MTKHLEKNWENRKIYKTKSRQTGGGGGEVRISKNTATLFCRQAGIDRRGNEIKENGIKKSTTMESINQRQWNQ